MQSWWNNRLHNVQNKRKKPFFSIAAVKTICHELQLLRFLKRNATKAIWRMSTRERFTKTHRKLGFSKTAKKKSKKRKILECLFVQWSDVSKANVVSFRHNSSKVNSYISVFLMCSCFIIYWNLRKMLDQLLGKNVF